MGTCAVATAWPAARAAERAALSSPTSRAAAWDASEAPRMVDILNAPVSIHARRAAMASRGRRSPGCFSSKYGMTRSAQSMAQAASVLWSVLLTSPNVGSSMLVNENLDFILPILRLTHDPRTGALISSAPQIYSTAMFKVKRVYEPAEPSDGRRVLVDRLWPRGVSRASARIDEWMKDVAPSTELRKWFHGGSHDWQEFKLKYIQELQGKGELLDRLRAYSAEGDVTLLFAVRGEEKNHAVVLKEYLESS